MAVTTWTAGEVLTAADLNDTFASKLPYSYGTATPSTTDSGFLWYDSNSTPPTPKYWDGSSFAALAPAAGLELVTTETFTSVSAVSVNNVFTSTYDNYRLILRTVAASGTNVDIYLRLRASGTDANTSLTYQTQVLNAAGSTATALVSGVTTAAVIGFTSTTTQLFHAGSTDIYGAALAIPTLFTNISQDYTNTLQYLQTRAAYHNQSVAYDGLTLSPTTGTFSGTLRVYGYRNN